MTTPGYVSVDDFLPEVLQHCNGAPSIMARIHVVNAIILFCERTFILRNKDAAELTLDEDVHTYKLSFCDDRYVAISIDQAKLGDQDTDDHPLTSITVGVMDEAYPNWRQESGTEPTHVFLTDDINGIRVWPTPSADIDEDCHVSCTVRPKRNQTEFDEVVYEKWNDGIVAGALSTILLVQGASWFNERLAAIKESEFKSFIRRARATTITAPGKYPGRAIPQSFGDIGGGDYNRRTTSWV